MHARIQIYWCRSSIFRHLKLELLTQFPASNDEKYINVVYIWRKFVSFYGYVHWRMTTEISVMYGSEKVKCLAFIRLLVIYSCAYLMLLLDVVHEYQRYLTAKLFNWNFHPPEVMSRWYDPQLQWVKIIQILQNGGWCLVKWEHLTDLNHIQVSPSSDKNTKKEKSHYLTF